MGQICRIYRDNGLDHIMAETIGFKDEKVLLMPFGDLTGIGPGNIVEATNRPLTIPVGNDMKGRVLDGLGNPIDGKGPYRIDEYYDVNNIPNNPLSRTRISKPLTLGIRAIDGLLTCGQGQRMGIFAGSGVGKSTLLGMIARNSSSEINVIVLVGERGREVREFIEKDLREEGLKKSVVVVATSEQPALVRLKSAMIGTAIAEYFRDQGKHVLLLMDSLTRFAMAQREIGLASGEPPVSRGYTPSVFAIMPKLLERAGTSDKGSITGLYTVLVDGDDLNEPVTDMVRGILDGHIVLSRKLANNNHYPAIDILGSVSRVMSDIVTDEHKEVANKIRSLMAVYRDMQEIISIGAYKKGTDPALDEAIELIKPINKFLTQKTTEVSVWEDTYNQLVNIIKKSDRA